ncbi:hypothetical protein EB118_20115 [bacterium]|nr:hypothetical protein [bacterium]NDG32368.1 hypothetical protein [bacterium]
MNFKQFFYEEFISPFVQRTMSQNAINAGPDTGMTSGDINNTFPSSVKTTPIILPKKKKKIKKKKD